MAVPPRFYAPRLDTSDASVTLDADEAHHLVHVLRLAAGTPVEVFDGHGRTLLGIVGAITKKAVVIDRLAPVASGREPRVPLALAIGWLRSDYMDAVMRDATMLGVRSIHPLITSRTTARHAGRDTSHLLERWRRIAVGALKQCGGAWMPAIAAATPIDRWLAGPAAPVGLILAEPDAHDGAAIVDVDGLAAEAAGGVALMIGPEGGWSPDEVEAAAGAGYRAWSLGTRVLRADAVPVAAISALRYAWERRPPV